MYGHLEQPDLRRSGLIRHLPVYRATDFRATEGVNEGDPLTDAADLAYEDVYALAADARPTRLGLLGGGAQDPFLVSRHSATGQPGAKVYLDSLLTFIGPAGDTLEALVFVEVASDGTIAEVYVHPLSPLPPNKGYALVTIDRAGARAKLAETASAAFTRGTRITLADGTRCPVEDIRAGDMVLTRDSGPQPVRWIGCDTLRAAGPFAPVTIRAGALRNTADLAASPGHRLFDPRQADAPGAGRKDMPLRAERLVNGTSVFRDKGGYVEYYRLLFDEHEIIYAEGIAAESLCVAAETRLAPPDAVTRRIGGAQARVRPQAGEVAASGIDRSPDPARALKRPSAI